MKKDKTETPAAPQPEVEGAAEEAEIIVGKHRNGPTGTAKVAFQRHYRLFRDVGAPQYDRTER